MRMYTGKKDEKIMREWCQKVQAKYTKIVGFSQMDAKVNYLEYVQQWPFYGAQFYPIEVWSIV